MVDKSPDYPEPPDPRETAAVQGDLNEQTAITQARLNMVDQQGPFGTLRYEEIPGSQQTQRAFDEEAYQAALDNWRESGQGSVSGEGGYWDESTSTWVVPQTGETSGAPRPDREMFYYQDDTGTPRYRAITELSPQQQQLQDQGFDIQTQLLGVGNDQIGRVSSALGQPLSFEGLPETAYGVPDYVQDRQRVEQALMERMNPYLERRQEQERTRLANQGFSDRGSEGYREAMDNVYRSENDARLAAIAQAGQEQSRLMQQAQAINAAQNAARQQGIQERLVSRQTPINEIGALMSGGQVTLPQFVGAPQTSVQAPDYQGAAFANYQALVDQANAQRQQQGQFAQGLFGLGGSALGGLFGGPFGAAAGGALFG